MRPRYLASGPFSAQHIRSGDPYELSNGHPIQCLPTGGQGSRANLLGGTVMESDPDVEEAGVDTGFSPHKGVLRAPDVAVGHVPNRPGWVQGVPPLALEYADTGQDEVALAEKIADLLDAGTSLIWVVRLTGPRRVEVYRPRQPVQVYLPGQFLEAPGILRNPVLVEALYDREAAHEATLRNLLQRRGYDSLEAVHAEGRIEGKAEGRIEGEIRLLLRQLRRRFGEPLPWVTERLTAAAPEQLEQWSERLLDAPTIEAIFEASGLPSTALPTAQAELVSNS